MTTTALRHSIRAACCALAVCAAVRADWQGTLHTTTEPAKPGMPPMRDGQVRAKKGRIRFDGVMGNAYVIHDLRTHKVRMVMPDQKAYMEMDSTDAQKVPGACGTESVEQCLRSEGFKKIGAETVEGRRCSNWERDDQGPTGPQHQKVCVPDGAKEPVFFKQVGQESGFTHTVVVKDYKETPQDDRLFEVPEGYAKRDISGMMEQAGRPPRGE